MPELDKSLKWLEDLNKKSSLSPKRNIEIYYQKIMDNTFWVLLPLIKDEKFKKEVEENIDNTLQTFNSAYWIVKEKFKYTERDSGERALNHMIWVTDEYIENFSKIKEKLEKRNLEKESWKEKAILLILNEIDKIITAFFHDIIEDTDISFEWLKTIIWEKNAFCVLLLTKEPFCNFIEDKKELEEIDKMKEIWLLNSKWELSDSFKKKIYLKENPTSNVEKIFMFWTENYEISDEEEILFERYKILKKKYKEKRNKAYFWHMDSLINLLHFTDDLLEKIELSKLKKNRLINDKIEILKNAIYVKISDRINNLRDISIAWSDNPERIEKKLKETEESILKLAKETTPEAYEILKNMIVEIRKNLKEKEIKKIKDNTKNKVREI